MSEMEMDYPLTGYEVVDRVLHSDRYGVSVMGWLCLHFGFAGVTSLNLLSQPHLPTAVYTLTLQVLYTLTLHVLYTLTLQVLYTLTLQVLYTLTLQVLYTLTLQVLYTLTYSCYVH